MYVLPQEKPQHGFNNAGFLHTDKHYSETEFEQLEYLALAEVSAFLHSLKL